MTNQRRRSGGDLLSDRAALERLVIRNLLATPGERVFFKDLESRFLLVSQGWLLDLGPGCGLDDVIGKSDFDFFSHEHAAAAFEDEQQIIRTGEAMLTKIERETFHGRPDAWVSTTKLPLVDDEGNIVGTFGISRDVTAQVMAEKALAHQALHDPVTGLPNRLALMDRLSQALLGLDRTCNRMALLFIDLDNFKMINDSLGHEAGDRVLVEVGRRLTRICRQGDTVARFGGDEFVMLCNVRDVDVVHSIAKRAVKAIGEKVVAEGQDFCITGSIGIVVNDDPSADPGVLLQAADIAMYQAKGAGRNRFQVSDGRLGSFADGA
ncbi:MAG: GGDEF domain-containing protein [Acidimicrobiales bacterium]